MNKAVPYIAVTCRRSIFVLSAMLLVLLSSCAVKASIKTLVGMPVNSEQGAPKGGHRFSIHSVEKCALLDVSDVQIVQQHSLHTNDLLPVVILTAVFLFIFGFRAVSKENQHPLYRSSGKIRSSIPLFLEYRKLIIYYSA